MKNRYLEAGKIINTHGIAGEVKIMPWADDAAFLLDFDTFYLDGRPVKCLSARVHKNFLLAKLEGVTDVNDAMKLRDRIICIDREDAVLEDGAFFLADLIDLPVKDAETGALLGRITEVLTPPANNVYVVKGETREYLIPAVPEFIIETNLDEGFMRVHLLEGM